MLVFLGYYLGSLKNPRDGHSGLSVAYHLVKEKNPRQACVWLSSNSACRGVLGGTGMTEKELYRTARMGSIRKADINPLKQEKQ